MGYDVHITRADYWAENHGFEISDEQWLQLIQGDRELIPMPENGKYFVVWHGTTKYTETWFDWSNGNIDTKAPDKATLRKMLQIADKLNAKIQGDDGELFDGDYIGSFNDSIQKKQNTWKLKRFKTFLLWICLILILFLFLLSTLFLKLTLISPVI